jgi:serine/threonine-protein kinase
VIHRDVKPNNLFIHRAPGGTERMKLIDFGVAAVSWAETRLTRSGARVGTPGYASPEQDAGEEADPRADIFGLGQTLKEAISGKQPAADESQKPQMPNEVPEEWRVVLAKMCAVDLESRYANAREAQKALAKLGGIDLAKSDSEPETSPDGTARDAISSKITS